MTGRERIEAAFSAERTPEFAVVIPYDELYVRDNWESVTSNPWWSAFDPNPQVQLKWRAEVMERLGQDWFQVPVLHSSKETAELSIDVREDGVYSINSRTGEAVLLKKPQVGGWNSEGEVESSQPKLIETPDDLDKLIPEPAGVSEIDWQGRDTVAKSLLSGPANDLYPIIRTSSPIWTCYDFWGFDGLMMKVALQPELVEHACNRLLALRLSDVRHFASLGAKAVWIEECLMDQISPEAYKTLNVPVMRRLIDEIRAAGMKSIYYFCGDPAGKWEHILSVGADALALEESKKGFSIDIGDVADIVRGRCTLLGNLDSVGVLQDGTDEQLRYEIKRQISAGRKNNSRFILSLGSPITPDTPLDRVRFYCELGHGLGCL